MMKAAPAAAFEVAQAEFLFQFFIIVFDEALVPLLVFITPDQVEVHSNGGAGSSGDKSMPSIA